MSTPVPTNLITGFLGAGKTTAIRHLLAERRPAGDRWAVLVNEFGDIGIDAARLDDGTAVEELPGGCLCCTLGTPFRVALARLLRRSRPQRLLIEPTGLGHPARIVDQLREHEAQGALDRRATLALIDPRQLEDPRIAAHEAFRNQAQLADILIAHKADLCTEAQLTALERWIGELYPPKTRLERAAHGRLDPSWLDEPAGLAGDAAPHTGDAAPPPHAEHQHQRSSPAPEPGRPVRAEQSGGDMPACGWLFHPEDRFERRALLEALEALRGCQRVKGVMRTGRDWLRVDADRDGVRAEAAAWRGESRLEVIGPAPGITWDAVEARLLGALHPASN